MTTAGRLLAAAAVSGAVAVAVGAFGAHALREAVTPDRLGTWQTGASYHLAHAVVGALAAVVGRESRWARRAASLFLAGTLLFSGSLYALVLLDAAWLGAVTPLGGVAFIAGWIALAVDGKEFKTFETPEETAEALLSLAREHNLAPSFMILFEEDAA